MSLPFRTLSHFLTKFSVVLFQFYSSRSYISFKLVAMFVWVCAGGLIGYHVTKSIFSNSVKCYCDNICSKANSTLGLLRRVLWDVKSKAYTTLVRPQLEYTCSVWNPYTKRNIHQIKLVQKRAARFVFRDYSNFSHVTPMLKQLSWDTLEQCRPLYQLSMSYKIQLGLVGISIPSEVYSLTRASQTPNESPFHHIQSSCNVYKYSLYPSSIEAWNKLPVTTDIFPFTKLWYNAHNKFHD